MCIWVYSQHRCISTHWPHSFAHSHRKTVIVYACFSLFSRCRCRCLSINFNWDYILFSTMVILLCFRDILSLPATNCYLFSFQLALYIYISGLNDLYVSISWTRWTNYRRSALIESEYIFWCVIMKMEFHLCWLIYNSQNLMKQNKQQQQTRVTEEKKTPITWKLILYLFLFIRMSMKSITQNDRLLRWWLLVSK